MPRPMKILACISAVVAVAIAIVMTRIVIQNNSKVPIGAAVFVGVAVGFGVGSMFLALTYRVVSQIVAARNIARALQKRMTGNDADHDDPNSD
jgi:hypothetical protein